MNFCSDNTTGVHPRILEALAAANGGHAMPYGGDDLTRRVERRLAEIFEHEVAVFLVGTGTAANVLPLAAMCPPWGAIYCHAESHVNTDECGAPEFYTGGAKLVALAGEHGKLSPALLDDVVSSAGAGMVHHVQPAALSLTQATEAGTVYRTQEIAALGDVARRHRLGLHVDGARFANAIVSLGCAPADVTWRAGVDALAFGATKNGCLAAEAVLVFERKLAETIAFRRKRGGQLWSKMRFLAAQFDAYLADDLWLANARHANTMARRLAEGLRGVPGASFAHPVEANEVFVRLPEPVIRGLEGDGVRFYRWLDERSTLLRLVTAFDTEPVDVDALIASAKRHASAAAT